MTMNDYKTVSNLRAEVERLGLLGMESVISMPIEDLADAYNGTGPEFLPQRIRQKLDAVCRPFLPAVEVHDVEFTLSDGTRRSFLIANRHLLWNCIICACDSHPWYSWRRYVLILEAWAMYRAVSHEQFGWVAWIQAYNKRKEKPNE